MRYLPFFQPVDVEAGVCEWSVGDYWVMCEQRSSRNYRLVLDLLNLDVLIAENSGSGMNAVIHKVRSSNWEVV